MSGPAEKALPAALSTTLKVLGFLFFPLVILQECAPGAYLKELKGGEGEG
jgi:hypothetical protein